ncbi:MAG: DUF5106 domain-containing protein [Muribaculaceae bacterium]|nr:DUF5106 domain-containing protein [Muribaculaceae bacterium]
MVLIRRILASLTIIVALTYPMSARVFPYPAVPDDMRTPADRATYLITHFWENANFSDPQEIEQGFVDFISVFPYAYTIGRPVAMSNLVRLSGASAEVLSLAEDYLYTPSSPVYNEEYFIYYLKALLGSGLLTDEQKVRPTYLLEEASLNRRGFPANDFTYTRPDGSTSTLYESLPSEGENMLLFFYDPTCDVCHHFMRKLEQSGCNLPVLAIYPDEDEEAWRNGLPEVPGRWRVGMADITGLYSIREFPSVYILSSEGKVIRKNISENDLPLSGK